MRDSSPNPSLVAVVLLSLFLSMPGRALAGVVLDDWRGEVGRVRSMAENNVPLAYKEAQRLQAAIPADATPVDHARALNLLARTEVYMALSEQAKKHARLALELATQNADRAGQAEADLNIGLSSVNQGDINALVAVSTHSLAMLDGVNRPDLLGEALLRASVMYRRTGQFDASVTMAIQAMEIAKRSNDPLVLTYAHQGMGIAFEQSDRLEEAREHFLKMREQARAAHTKLLEADALTSLGSIAKVEGKLLLADRLIREAVAIHRKAGAPFNLARGLFAQAEILRSQGRHAEAFTLLNEAIEIHEGHANKIGLWWALNARSEAYRDVGNAAAMRADVERAAALAWELNQPLYLSESTWRMAGIAAADGDHKRAYRLSVDAAKMADKAGREKISARMLQLSQHYESDSKQRQIDELNRSKAQQESEYQKRWLWTMLLGSIVLLGVSGLFLRRLSRSNRLLEAANGQLSLSQNNQQATLDAIPDTLFELGLDGRCYGFHSSRSDSRIAPIESFVGKTLFDALPHEAVEICLSALRETQEKGMSSGKQFELTLPHGKYCFELSVARKYVGPKEAPHFIVIARDISERKFAEQYELFRSRTLELLFGGDSLPDILESIVRGVEQLNPAMICCILQMDSQGKHLVNGIAPSLPDFYNAAIEGVEIGIGVGSCGTSAATGELVIVENIATHPYWAVGKEVALRAGLSACWSQPIRSSSGQILGTFAIYHHEVHTPTEFDISIIEQTAHLAGIAIERMQAEQQLRELTAHLQTIREEEKARLAREIHDDLGSTLAALKLRLSHMLDFELSEEMKKTPLFARLELMSPLLDNAIAATRRIITDMRPDVLDNLGLLAALKWQSEQFNQHTGIGCRIVCTDDHGCADCKGCEYQLSQVLSINLFRIFQEALANVARHSDASNVEVEYRPGDNEIFLSVSDNGCGLPEGKIVAITSYGIRGMRERVGQLGGEIVFDSPPGGGLRVMVRVPLQPRK